MRFLPPIFCLFFSNAVWAGDVNWRHFAPIRPKSFDSGALNYPTYSNENPSVIAEYILSENRLISPVHRALHCVRVVLKRHALIEQKALLMRDCFDAIHTLSGVPWTAHDEMRGRTVIFYGRFLDATTRFALAFSLDTGEVFLGKPNCSTLISTTTEPNLQNETEWRPFAPDLVPCFSNTAS